MMLNWISTSKKNSFRNSNNQKKDKNNSCNHKDNFLSMPKLKETIPDHNRCSLPNSCNKCNSYTLNSCPWWWECHHQWWCLISLACLKEVPSKCLPPWWISHNFLRDSHQLKWIWWEDMLEVTNQCLNKEEDNKCNNKEFSNKDNKTEED